MNNRQKVTTTLLAVIAVLLALNLFSMASQTANAETVLVGEDDPYIVKLLPRSPILYYRVWSDGRMDNMLREESNCEFVPEGIFGAVEHPFPVVDVVQDSGGATVMMTFEDGRVDLVGPTGDIHRCTIAGIGTPSLCTADTDRDGIVGTGDLLTLLSQWGVCE